MAAKAFPSLALVAFAILGPVCGFHRDYPVAIQYLHRMLFGGTEANDDVFNHTARNSPTLMLSARRSNAGSSNDPGHGVMSAHVNGPQHDESVTNAQGARHKLSAPDLTDVEIDDVSADVYAWTRGFNISMANREAETAEEYQAEVKIGDGVHERNVSSVSDWDGAFQGIRVKDQIQDPTQSASIPSPSADAETTEEDEAKIHIRAKVHEVNVSGFSNQDRAHENSHIRVQAHDQGHNRNQSSSNNRVYRGYADSAKNFMRRALEAAKAQDQEAAERMEKALATFRKAQDAQDKADAAVKSALDAEVQLIDAKAATLRNASAARELAAAAARANMDLSSSSSKFQRETHTADAAVLRAKHSLDTVRGKLSVAERASAVKQRAAAQAAHDTVAAHHELEVAKASAADAALKKARVEKQVAQSSKEIARMSEKFDNANKAKEEALRSFQTAKQELADAVHVGVAMAHRARNASSLMLSSGSMQRHEAVGVK